MKKLMLSALGLCCSLAALAQAPTAPDARRADQAAKAHKQGVKTRQHGDDDDRTGGQARKPANHGPAVSTLAQSTALTGADKGAAVRAVASDGRSTAHAPRRARGGEHGHGGGPEKANGTLPQGGWGKVRVGQYTGC
jgi:hypothetical protein